MVVLLNHLHIFSLSLTIAHITLLVVFMTVMRVHRPKLSAWMGTNANVGFVCSVGEWVSSMMQKQMRAS
jgi:hypothetical protein